MKEKRNLLISIFLSIILGWILGFLRLPYFEKNFSFLLGFLACLALVSLIILIAFVWNKNSSLLRLLGKHQTTHESQKPSKTYLLIWSLASTLMLIGGIVSSILIFQQNQFQKKQTHLQYIKIDEQSKLMESSRKSNLLVLINDLYDRIDEELNNHPQRILSDQMITRIATLNYSFQPYQYLEGDTLSKKWSPERGQLLLMLCRMNMDSSSFDKIKSQTSFAGADLKNANLNGADLSGVDLKNANLKNANLSEANLSGADLTEAFLWGGNFKKIDLSKAILKNANLSWAELNGANLRNANFNGANLTAAKFREVDARKANLSWTKMNGVFLNNSNLAEANLTATDLGKANLTETDLRKSILKFANLSEANLTKVILSETDLTRAAVSTNNWFEKLKEWQVIDAKTIQAKYKLEPDVSKQFNYRLMRK